MNRPLILLTVALVGLAAFAVAAAGPVILRRQYQEDALRTLTRLARTASVYYVSPHIASDGDRAPCSFPQGEIRTTLAPSCWDPRVGDGEGLCDPAKIEWNRSLWVLLKWQQSEPQPWVYAYSSTGTMAHAEFTVSAFGDLDGDGVFSTFRYIGHGSAQSRADDCVITETPRFEAIAAGE